MQMQIIGIGTVGSSLGNELLYRGVEILTLVDINLNRLKGEVMDLERVIKIKELDTMIITSSEPIPTGNKINIICVGHTTDYSYPSDKECHQRLYEKNYPTVKRLVSKIKEGAIIIVTNPANLIWRQLIRDFPKKDISYVGDEVDRICSGKMIKSLKGYTNWGIIAELTSLIFSSPFLERLCIQKKD